MENAIKTYVNPQNGEKLKIYPDFCPENPRNWDNRGSFVVPERCRYADSEYDAGLEFDSRDADEKRLSKNPDIVCFLPLYVYDHSGIAMNTTGFSCPWDSGQIGYIVVTRERLKSMFPSWRRVSRPRRELLEAYLRSEVQTAADYLEGNVYGFIVEDENGGEIDSCWGYYGDAGIKYIEEEHPEFKEAI